MKSRLKNSGSAPLEIPKWALLETQVEQSITRQVRIWDKKRRFLTGSVFLITVFVVALLAVLTMGILQMNTEEIQLMQNQIYAAEALATAEAGLNDAFKELRTDPNWSTGFTDKAFNGNANDTYTVTVTGSLPNLTIVSEANSPQSFIARVEADVTVGSSSPYVIRIDNLRINE